MNETKPQWEWIVIPKVKLRCHDTPQMVRLFRFHHAYMDGGSCGLLIGDGILEFSDALGRSIDRPPYVIDPLAKPLKPKEQIQAVLAKWLGITGLPFFVIDPIFHPSRYPKSDKIAYKPEKGGSGCRNFCISRRLDFETIRAIKSFSARPVSFILVDSVLKSISIVSRHFQFNVSSSQVIA